MHGAGRPLLSEVPLKIVSITVTSNRAGVIGDALRSVAGWTDLFLIVDLGITDDTLEVARGIAGAKLRVVRWDGPVEDGPFADIRNFGLDEAAQMGADWGCILDTDDRMETGDVDIKAELAVIGSGIVVVPCAEETYAKERFVKLPAVDRYTGGSHETIIPKRGKQTVLNSIHFSEVPKTPEQLKAKLLYLVDRLVKETDADPGNPRLWYYLGDTLAGLDRNEEALKAFDRCSALRGWDEESAWACFRMAVLLEGMGRRLDAIDICAAGLTRHAGIAELAWFAGEMSLRLGKAEQAIYWARLAVANGTSHGEGHFVRPRVGFRYPFGTREGPYNLLSRAYRALGMGKEAAAAEVIYNELLGGQNGAC